ncbi:MAG: M15 family metallopeptidase [Cyanobacteria bacterium J06643_4]
MLTKLFHRFPKPYRLLVIGIASALCAIAIGVFTLSLIPPLETATSSPQEATNSEIVTSQAEPPPEDLTTISPVPDVPESPISAEARADARAGADDTPENIDQYAEPYDDVVSSEGVPSQFNHLAYAEADPSRIVPVGKFIREGYERDEFLDADAAQAFVNMTAAASAEGIQLIPVSGFRTIARQQALFDNQVEKLGSAEEAAKLSAPPGHSEHHTGYAIDIGDATAPDTDIKYEFEYTPAYSWLQANAGAYGFELSFPRNNQQGVSFEPWHWRFVASAHAQETFYFGRALSTSP